MYPTPCSCLSIFLPHLLAWHWGVNSWAVNFNFSLRTSTKIELILAKSACFTTPVNIQEMTICPLHRERLGIGWRRSIIQRSVPEELSGHDDTAKQKAERGCTLLQSKLILQAIEKNSFQLVQVNKCFMFWILLCDIHWFMSAPKTDNFWIILSQLFKRCYTLFFYKNVVFPVQAEYFYFFVDFRLEIFLYYS